MKKIEAIIKPFKLDEVKDALQDMGFSGMIVTEVRDFEGQNGNSDVYQGAEYVVDFLPKVKIEVVVEDDATEKAMDIILNATDTESSPGSRIFVFAVERHVI